MRFIKNDIHPCERSNRWHRTTVWRNKWRVRTDKDDNRRTELTFHLNSQPTSREHHSGLSISTCLTYCTFGFIRCKWGSLEEGSTYLSPWGLRLSKSASFIAGCSASAPSSEGIKKWAVKKIYQLRETHDLPNLWAYLWENSYRSGRWELWMWWVVPEIPLLKTTMMVKAQ